MGYDTEFQGHLSITPPLSPELTAYVNRFCETRRMKRNAAMTEKLPDPLRLAVGLPVGIQGGYYVGDTNAVGQSNTPDIVDYNTHPAGQHGLWCNWKIASDGSKLKWNGHEKFYAYVEWLKFLITHFMAPRGHVLNGVIKWRGEEFDDTGKIVVTDNVVTVK